MVHVTAQPQGRYRLAKENTRPWIRYDSTNGARSNKSIVFGTGVSVDTGCIVTIVSIANGTVMTARPLKTPIHNIFFIDNRPSNGITNADLPVRIANAAIKP